MSEPAPITEMGQTVIPGGTNALKGGRDDGFGLNQPSIGHQTIPGGSNGAKGGRPDGTGDITSYVHPADEAGVSPRRINDHVRPA